MQIMNYLYHYTNIETLALILRNHTIRFNSLDKMDDLQEKETADLKNIGQFCYISSWTDNEIESIPMWNMYASLERGIRIMLPQNPFMIYDNRAEELQKVTSYPVQDASNGSPLQSIIPLAEMFSKGFFTIQAINKNILFKVEYTDDKDKLYPQLLKDEGEGFSIALDELGKYKNLHWAFQREWRYILNVLPLDLNQPIENLFRNFEITTNKIRLDSEKQPLSYYDMHLSDEAFENMHITLSPRISTGNRIIIQSLIEKYNPSAIISDSALIKLI
ncbi:DUF2971 domain-containing protein [Dorea sp. D27]|uniref:DUF2971 domain-containing protein n=1 Tax=Dorea sp. D27 TaxID=658665 RepID=UPI000673C1A5|nr:DUF2971 domain-containing protein [Dorea sp. D27]KMZ55516.1 hypothetical protein HMPREF0980_00213 [Dorea sp. D27]